MGRRAHSMQMFWTSAPSCSTDLRATAGAAPVCQVKPAPNVMVGAR